MYYLASVVSRCGLRWFFRAGTTPGGRRPVFTSQPLAVSLCSYRNLFPGSRRTYSRTREPERKNRLVSWRVKKIRAKLEPARRENIHFWLERELSQILSICSEPHVSVMLRLNSFYSPITGSYLSSFHHLLRFYCT